MKYVGKLLNKERLKKNLTLKEVQYATGIPDSTLSRIEQGKITKPSIKIIKKLTDFYKSSIIPLYISCGYLQENDLEKYQQYFSEIDKLTLEEKEHIQNLINLFLKNKGDENNDI